MAQLTLKNVSKSFGTVEVIPGIDLDIKSGEFVVLVGPSGSGKSTLLRMIAGLESTSGGHIEVDGEDITNVDPSARDLAMVFQTYALYPHMTVERNMAFALKMRKTDPVEIDRRVREAMEILELTGLEKRKPGQLSGGQRQRVAMGRCIVRNPKLFLFDEPLSNLDAKLRAQTRLEIRRLHERLNATSIFVTHDQVEAMTMADRIALLKDGRLQQIGTPQELYLNPANRFVATFLGTPEMNMFTGQLAEDADGFLLDGTTPLRLVCTEEKRKKITNHVGTAIEVGVRPEHLQMVEPGSKGALELKMVVPEWLGHEAFLFCEAGGRQIAISGPTDPGGLPRVGDRLFVSPIADSWHMFDTDNGTSLLA